MEKPFEQKTVAEASRGADSAKDKISTRIQTIPEIVSFSILKEKEGNNSRKGKRY